MVLSSGQFQFWNGVASAGKTGRLSSIILDPLVECSVCPGSVYFLGHHFARLRFTELRSSVLQLFVSGAGVDDPPRDAGGFLLVTAAGTPLNWIRYIPWRTSINSKSGTLIGIFGLTGLMVFSGRHLAGEITKIL